MKRHEKLIYGSNRYLWLFGLMFHWSLLIILFRHMRFFMDFPGISRVESIDGFFRIGLPALYMSNVFIAAALIFLFARRLTPRLRMISLPQDYFSLFLLMAVIASGMLMRYCFRADVERVKEVMTALVSLKPIAPAGIGAFFYIHLFLVSILFAWFPFSKLMHAPGVFLSPTRNLKNDSRARRHVNPWNYPVKVHTYEEYEEEFGEAMEEAGPARGEGGHAWPSRNRKRCFKASTTRHPGVDDPVRPFRKGTYSYGAPVKHQKYLGLPNIREWQPTDADWKLPENWKEIVLEA